MTNFSSEAYFTAKIVDKWNHIRLINVAVPNTKNAMKNALEKVSVSPEVAKVIGIKGGYSTDIRDCFYNESFVCVKE